MVNRSMKILIINNSSDNFDILAALIKESFPEAVVFKALSGIQGLEIAVQEDPDMILLDMILTGIDGFEVLRQLKDNEALSKIPVLFFIEINEARENRIRALECGAETFITKPIDGIELIALIRMMIKIREINIQINNENKRLTELLDEKTKELIRETTAREESERALHEVQILMHIGSFEFDVLNSNLLCSDEVLRICGIEQDDFTGAPSAIIECTHPENKKFVLEQIAKAVSEKASREYESRLIRLDGEERTVRVRTAAVFDKNDCHIRNVGTIQDITDIKMVEEQLHQNMIDLLETQKIAHLGTWRLNLATNEVVWSEELYQMYGFDPKMPPPPYSEHMRLFTSDSWNILSVSLERTRAFGIPYELELQTVSVDGSNRWMWVRGEATRDLNGNIVALWGAAQDITNSVRAEISLKDGEEKFRYIFENSAVGNVLTLPYGEMVVNDTMSKMLGYTKEELKGKLWRDISYPDDTESTQSEINQLLVGEKTFVRFNKRYIKKDGSVLWADVLTSLRKDADGNPLHFMTAIIDIAEQKAAEIALRESEERYKSLYEHCGLGIGYYTPDGTVISYNKKAKENMGENQINVIGMSIYDLFPEADANRYISRITKAVASDKPQVYEDYFKIPTESKWFSSTFSRVLDGYGNVTGVQIISQDITTQKQAEVSLTESEKRYRMLYTSMNQGLALHEIITDADNKPVDYVFIDINDSYTRLLGVTREMCIDKKITEVMPNVEQYWIDIFGKVALTGESAYYENQLETTGRFYSTYSYSPQERQFAVLVSDITEQKQHEEQLIYLSYHDQLTGLFNRRLFEEELERLDTEGNLPLTIVMADVNGLKLINDSFGHDVGDAYLKKAAMVIQTECRAEDILARLGGDEFVLILPKMETSHAEQLINRLRSKLLNEKMEHTALSISFGYDTKINMKDNINQILASAENLMYKRKVYESASMHSKTVDIVMNTLFEKSSRELLHSRRVSHFCEALAIKMNMDIDTVNQIKTAGLVHDIGKIGIDERILNKLGELNNEEWNEIKKHPESGWRILVSAKEFSELADFVRQHHERWDGKGYPKGLKGEEISIEARIITIVDSYDAMTSERSYRKGISTQEAINEIERSSGTQFDPNIVRVFIDKVLIGN